jgi:hypothetical protein
MIIRPANARNLTTPQYQPSKSTASRKTSPDTFEHAIKPHIWSPEHLIMTDSIIPWISHNIPELSHGEDMQP